MNVVDITNQIAQQQQEKEPSLTDKLMQVQDEITRQRLSYTNQYMSYCGSVVLNLLQARPEISAKDAVELGLAVTETFREALSGYESKLMEIAPVHPSLVKAKMEIEAKLKEEFTSRPERETSSELN